MPNQGTVTLTAGWTRLERGAMPMPYDPRLIGAKAWNLGVVRSLGFRVPDFVLVNQEDAQRVARRPTSRASTKIVQPRARRSWAFVTATSLRCAAVQSARIVRMVPWRDSSEACSMLIRRMSPRRSATLWTATAPAATAALTAAR